MAILTESPPALTTTTYRPRPRTGLRLVMVGRRASRARPIGLWAAVAAAISSTAFMVGVALGIFGVLVLPAVYFKRLSPSMQLEVLR